MSIGSAQTIPKYQIPQINKWVLRELQAVGEAQIERLDSMPSALYLFSLESDNKVAGTEQEDSWLENKVWELSRTSLLYSGLHSLEKTKLS